MGATMKRKSNINYIRKDPDPCAAPFHTPVSLAPLRDRAKSKAHFDFGYLSPRGRYPKGGVNFVQWQVRQAAIAAIVAFETIRGRSLSRWRDKGAIKVEFATPGSANAYYYGKTLEFAQVTAVVPTGFTGESADIVSHEVGHAILDAIRPDLWDTKLPEAESFHEAFGDCLAMLNALSQVAIRRHLIGHNLLNQDNCVESFGSHLATLANEPTPLRKALNGMQWRKYTRTDNPHSFSQIFTACFYDLIRKLYAANGTISEKGLLTASKQAGKLLFKAVESAALSVRFYRSIGKTMAECAPSGSIAQSMVIEAFGDHGIRWDEEPFKTKRSSLPGHLKRPSSRKATLDTTALDEIRARIGGGVDLGRKNAFANKARPVQIGSYSMAEVIVPFEIAIGRLKETPDGSYIEIPASILVDDIASPDSGAETLEVVGRMPNLDDLTEESTVFVDSLTSDKRTQGADAGLTQEIYAATGAAWGRSAHVALSVDSSSKLEPGVTHVYVAGPTNRQELKRVRFSCGCRRASE